jgi:tryptophan-rich sensory protein
MNHFAILTSSKRAVIALVHSVVFLFLALRTVANPAVARPIWLAASSAGPVAILFVYATVAAILIYLVRISRAAKEKLYFLFCAASASTGLLRGIFGDPAPHVAGCIRVLLLSCAVGTAIIITRGYFGIPFSLEQSD